MRPTKPDTSTIQLKETNLAQMPGLMVKVTLNNNSNPIIVKVP
jgi:hypothetical protein